MHFITICGQLQRATLAEWGVHGDTLARWPGRSAYFITISGQLQKVTMKAGGAWVYAFLGTAQVAQQVRHSSRAARRPV